MVQPINVIFKNLQQRQKVVVWLYDNIEMRIEGKIIATFARPTRRTCHIRAFSRSFRALFPTLPLLPHCCNRSRLLTLCSLLQGFDEFMNLVIDDAAEVFVKDAKPRREIGRILLKGDNITLIQQIV